MLRPFNGNSVMRCESTTCLSVAPEVSTRLALACTVMDSVGAPGSKMKSVRTFSSTCTRIPGLTARLKPLTLTSTSNVPTGRDAN
jgi:hypothetical protein